MNIKHPRYPLYVRLAIVSAVTGMAGWITYLASASFADPRLSELVSTIGSSMLSVCSLMFLVVGVLTVFNSLQTKSFRLTHGIVLFITCCVTLAAGVDGAYPR